MSDSQVRQQPCVVHLIVTYRRGGTEQVALELMRYSAASGWRVGAILPPTDQLDSLADEIRLIGGTVARIGPLFERARHPLMNLWRIFRYLRVTEASVVHLHFPWAPTCWEALVAAWLARTPVRIRTEHNPIVESLSVLQLAKLRFLDLLVDRIVCVSTVNRLRHVTNGRRRAAKICVIPNGIAPSTKQDFSADERAETRRRLVLPVNDTLAVMVGIEERKGVLDFVRAAASPELANVGFVVVGDGEMRGVAEELASGLGLDNRVHFLGARTDVREILPAFDIYVQPSHYEGMSIAMLEALDAGLPMVTTDVDGVSDVVIDPDSAIVCAVGDLDGLADGISRLAADAEVRHRMAMASQQRVRVSFNIERMCAAYLCLYRDLSHQRGLRGSDLG